MKTEDVNGKTLETWDVDEVHEGWRDGRIVLVDVRSPQEYMMEHVRGSLLMPMPDFEPEGLPDQGVKQIVLMCGSDTRSGKMARKALEAGIDRIAHMEGGFAAWKKAEKPHVAIELSTGAPKDVNG